ncbi:ABC transporter ATP-binding protein [Streptomyces albiaxialis]|uniref:ABC transporter ATP-binding protein n=1 Tax=Streptomyces albiaxialis TaxID=329523 RepID=A0ABN2WC23_9ACTN
MADADGTRGGGTVRAGFRFLRGRRRAVAALAGWSLLESVQTFALGYALARALDDGFLAGRTATGLAWLGVAGLGALVGALGTARVYRALAALAEPFRDLLVRRVVARGLGAALRDGTGDTAVVSRLTHQVEIARDSFAGVVMVARSFVFTALGALVGLASLAPPLLLVVLPPLLLGLALFFGTLRPLARRQRELLVADEELAEELGVTAGGLRDVAAAGAQESVRDRAGARIDAERRAADSLARWGVSRALAVGIGGRLPVVLLVVLAPWLLDRGVTAGALAAALTYLTQALLPALQSLVHGFGSAGARLTVVIGRLTRDTGAPTHERTSGTPSAPGPGEGPAAPDSAPDPAAPDPGAARIADPGAGTAATSPEPRAPRRDAGRADVPALEARGVSFAYGPGAQPVLEGLDLVVPHGGWLAVVGPSGIGKSTLALLAAGLLEPRDGEILVGGVPAAPAPAASRVLIPQEAYVFGGSVRDNLTYYGPRGDDEVHASARAVGADALVARLGGLDAEVDPRALSAGERQLLALTRAHLAPAPLAVLDEATCHLDPAAEERAERAFARREGGTLIVVAHRLSSARRAGRVLVLDGTHAVTGTHREVAEHSPLYRDLTGIWSSRPGSPGQGSSQPARPLGDTDGVDAVAGPGLAGDGRHVVPHRAVGEAEPVRDLRDRGPLGGDG